MTDIDLNPLPVDLTEQDKPADQAPIQPTADEHDVESSTGGFSTGEF